MQTLWQDLRYAARMLAKKPGFTVVAIMTLALGIGANTAIFSVANAVLFRPLPFKDHSQLLMLWQINPKLAATEISVKAEDYLQWREHSQSFQQIAATRGRTANLMDAGEPERISGLAVTVNFFSLLGVNPFIGRNFQDEDGQSGQNQVCIISQGLWLRRFGSDPGILGKQLKLNDKSYSIVGVLPSTFQLPTSEAEIWTPLTITPEDVRNGAHMLGVIGRLKPAVTIQQARTELNLLSSSLNQQRGSSMQDVTASLIPLQEQGVTAARPSLFILLGAVAFLLLISCANVANLLLARTASRSKEFAVRLALGAGRLRLARQLFTESLLLAVCGGTSGLLLGMLCVDLFAALGPKNIPRLRDTHLDVRVIGFALALVLLTTFLSGLAPALASLKTQLNPTLKAGSTGISKGAWQLSVITVTEISLALVLLIGAGLLLKSFARLTRVDPGFKSENVLTLNLALPSSKYREDYQRNAFFQNVISRVETLPGVQSAAMIQNLPFSGDDGAFYFIDVEGQPPGKPGEYLRGEFHSISSDYFRTLGIPLLNGRTFTERDAKESSGVIIITDRMARKFFSGSDPIGKKITILNGEKPREIVGVVGDVKHKGLDKEVSPEMYVPYQQFSTYGGVLVARTASNPLSLIPMIKEQVWAVDKAQPVYRINTMNQLLSESVAQQRFSTLLLAAFACVAMLLASIGIYGVMSYTVSQSTQEIGIRMALGAQISNVLKLVLGSGLKLILFGVAIGLAGAFALTRLMSALLFGVTPTDAMTFAAVSLSFIVVAVLACVIPARRATKVDPLVALRYE